MILFQSDYQMLSPGPTVSPRNGLLVLLGCLVGPPSTLCVISIPIPRVVRVRHIVPIWRFGSGMFLFKSPHVTQESSLCLLQICGASVVTSLQDDSAN